MTLQERLLALRGNYLGDGVQPPIMRQEIIAELDRLEREVEALRADAERDSLLWLWKNFVDGRPEYWAFDNPFPMHLDCGDPQTIGEPCGYAIFKPSRRGRSDVTEDQVLERIKRTKE